MNTRSKSVLILVGVLIIGVIIGALGSTILRRQMWEDRISHFKKPDGFINRLIEKIEPEPDQEKAIREILSKHHQKMIKISEESRNMIKSHADSLILELKPILSKEQLDKLEKILKRKRPGNRHPHGEPDPPPPDGQ
jgi:hypothetical protein